MDENYKLKHVAVFLEILNDYIRMHLRVHKRVL